MAIDGKQMAEQEALAAYHQGCVARWSGPEYEYDRRFVRLTLMTETADGVMREAGRKPSHDLGQLLGEIQERAAVLIGRPGSGKTTLLGKRQLEHAQAELDAFTGQVSFFVWLNQYRGLDVDDPPPEPYLWLAGEWDEFYPDLPRFETLFRAGRFLFLFDGLNEMPHQDEKDYAARISRWQAFLRRALHFRNRAVFSCREENYSPTLSNGPLKVRRIDVQPLSPEQIAEFLDHYLPEEGAAVYDELATDARQLELYGNPFFLRLLVKWVARAENRGGRLPKGQAELLTGFVRQALRRELERGSGRWFNDDRLLSRDDRRQIEAPVGRAWAGNYDLPAQGLLIPQLETLAFAMQDGRQRGENAQVSLPEQQARQLLDGDMAEAVLAAGLQLNILDKDLTKREIKFFHQLIQEYFAARVLARRPEPERVAVEWDTRRISPSLEEVRKTWPRGESILRSLGTTGWEETMVLAAAMACGAEEQGSGGAGERFVDGLTLVNLPLAGRAAAAPEVRPHLNVDFVERLQQELLERIGDPLADLRARIAAAEALGELGDPRFVREQGELGREYIRPLLAFIPGGTYLIGDNEGQFNFEKPAHRVEIGGFETAVFPVTNAEYRLFMEAGGYEDERWWKTEAAREWLRGESSNESMQAWYRDLAETLRKNWSDEALRSHPSFTPEQVDAYIWLKGAEEEELTQQVDKWYPQGDVQDKPEYWEDSRFNHPSRPVVGVSWYEARAYCAWLSAQTGDSYSLPSEAEWEAAARGALIDDTSDVVAGVGAGFKPAPTARTYAYVDGDEYDAAKCNTFETHIRATTPVGVFPEGRTPEGVYDLAGNVWEWTSTIYRDYPYEKEDGREEAETSDPLARRVVRGGSWGPNHVLARAVPRPHHDPLDRCGSGGFRVVRRPPSQNEH